MKTFLIVVALAIFNIVIYIWIARASNPAPATDYQLVVKNDTILLMDSAVVVKVVPYSDSSDLWKMIINDNR